MLESESSALPFGDSPSILKERFTAQCCPHSENNLARPDQLGYKDSNLEMLESESSALPFGDSPIFCGLHFLPQALVHYIIPPFILQAFFLIFLFPHNLTNTLHDPKNQFYPLKWRNQIVTIHVWRDIPGNLG